MRISRLYLAALIVAPLALLTDAARAQSPAPDTMTSGAELVTRNCFQCHTDSMFRDQRQDRRAWEATIYRMVGRGGLWTQDEIGMMADYLASALGPDVPRAAAQSK